MDELTEADKRNHEGATKHMRKKRAEKGVYDLSTIHGRLSHARAQHYPTASAAAVKNRWSIPTTGQHENGTRRLTVDMAIKYAAAYGVTLDYLFLGNQGASSAGITLNPLAIQSIPHIDLSDIDTLVAFASEMRGMSNRTLPVPPQGGQPLSSKIFVKMSDDSMQSDTNPNSIKKGDDVELGAYEPWKPGDFVAAIVEGQPSAVIRQYRLVSVNPEIIELEPLNRHYPILRIDAQNKGMIVARAVRRLTEL